MRKILITAILLLTIFTFGGCGQTVGTSTRTNSENAVEKAINEQIEKTDTSDKTEESSVVSEINAGSADSVLTESYTESDEGSIQTEESSEQAEESISSDKIDYDLTDMNADMVYATVYQMMVEPDTYIGQTVKMSGQFATVIDEQNGNRYYACIIQDALACCAQGFEFIWDDGSHVYPDEYPSDGAEITVQGVFETYKENGYLY